MALPPPSYGSTILITGASSGIGADLARQLAERGYNVTLTARRRERLEELAGELREAHDVHVDVETCDLGDAAARRKLTGKLLAGEREVVGVCNNAGFGNLGRFLDLDLEQETDVVRLNVEAVHELTGAFLPRMVEQGSGAILNVASTAAFQPLPGFATYAASKAFVHSFSEAVHSELDGHRRVGHLALPRLHQDGVRGGGGRRGRGLEAPRLHLDGVRGRRAPGDRGHARRQAHGRAGRGQQGRLDQRPLHAAHGAAAADRRVSRSG